MPFFTNTPPDTLFTIGSISISFYGIIFATAVVLGYLVTIYLAKQYSKVLKHNLEEYIDKLIILLVIVGVVAARLTFVAYNLDYFSTRPLEVFYIWYGGWVWHGAFIAGTIAVIIYSWIKKIPFWLFADIMAPGIVLGQAVGRWGNYFNQEAYGLPTQVFWAIPIDLAQRVTGYEGFSHFHPTFLYESIWDLVIFLVLFLASRQIIINLAKRSKRDTQKVARFGIIFLSYAIVYSLGRFLIEFLRIDVVPVILGLRAPQVISAAVIIIGIYYLFSGFNTGMKGILFHK